MTARSTRWRTAGRLAAAALLLALLAVALRRFDADRVVAAFAAAQPAWLLGALALYLAILPLWALQWCILAPVSRRPPFGTMLGVIAMTSSVLNTTPMLFGEAAGVALLVARAGLARAAALSVLAMDQLLVGMAKVAVLLLATWLLVLPVWMERGLRALAVLVLALLLGLLAVAWGSAPLRVLSRRLPPRGDRLLRAVHDALAPLRSLRRGGGALALALAKKLAEVLAILCVQRAFGVELPLASGVLVLASLNLATLVPVVPGNVGVFEAVIVVAYGYLGVEPERALGIALMQHACYFAALALPGYAWLARGVAPRRAAAAP